MLYIGSRIRLARKEAGLTQLQLAEQISVDRSMVIHYEKEKYAIPYATLDRLADVSLRGVEQPTDMCRALEFVPLASPRVSWLRFNPRGKNYM